MTLTFARIFPAESEQRTDRLFGLVNLAALALLCLALAQLTWKIIDPAPSFRTLVPAGTSSGPSSPTINLGAIKNANLFGKAQTPGTTTLAEIPLSSLNLKLNGVVAAGPDSVALISVTGQPEAPFFIGEEVSPGVTLDSVHADRIFLARNGVLESILLEDQGSPLPEGAVVNSPPPSSPGDSVTELGQNNYAIPRNLIDSQLANPEFLRNARIVSNKDGGFLVKNIKPGSLYEKLGLQKGDVIIGANGQPINNIQDAMRQYQQLGTLGQVELEVKRGGNRQTLNFHLQ
ncbi:MAG: PDZ domain-containing protein [Gammaproteobacteria bacterium]|nr:PDZ domain-containing protein [Gammaproteobacteria bacterium]